MSLGGVYVSCSKEHAAHLVVEIDLRECGVFCAAFPDIPSRVEECFGRVLGQTPTAVCAIASMCLFFDTLVFRPDVDYNVPSSLHPAGSLTCWDVLRYIYIRSSGCRDLDANRLFTPIIFRLRLSVSRYSTAREK